MTSPLSRPTTRTCSADGSQLDHYVVDTFNTQHAPLALPISRRTQDKFRQGKPRLIRTDVAVLFVGDEAERVADASPGRARR